MTSTEEDEHPRPEKLRNIGGQIFCTCMILYLIQFDNLQYEYQVQHTLNGYNGQQLRKVQLKKSK